MQQLEVLALCHDELVVSFQEEAECQMQSDQSRAFPSKDFHVQAGRQGLVIWAGSERGKLTVAKETTNAAKSCSTLKPSITPRWICSTVADPLQPVKQDDDLG